MQLISVNAQNSKKKNWNSSRENWRAYYSRGLLLTDLLTLVWVVFGTQIVWFGLGNVEVAMREDVRISYITYWLFSAVLVLIWVWALSLVDSRDHRIIGSGFEEYKRIFQCSFWLFGIIAITAFLSRIDIARGYLLISLPAGVLTLWLTRWLWRQWLNAKRVNGSMCAKVIVAGHSTSVLRVANELNASPASGYLVVGAIVPTGDTAMLKELEVPIWADLDQVGFVFDKTSADTLVFTGSSELPASRVREISWQLNPFTQHLIMAPALTDVGGPRISTRPVSGLPLMHVEIPKFSNAQLIGKRTFDIFVSAFLLIFISPILFCTALAVKMTSTGPIFYLQKRVGYRGSTFKMFKFRSMVADADSQHVNLERDTSLSENNVLFKQKNDPRVTKIGKVIRRFSLDELPQLLNVLIGDMSLVGPRPSLPREVEKYADHVHRRFLVKPGITGLWQVSGRSKLSWDESVRLDLYYVENWSFAADLAILLKTARAVVSADGAY